MYICQHYITISLAVQRRHSIVISSSSWRHGIVRALWKICHFAWSHTSDIYLLWNTVLVDKSVFMVSLGMCGLDKSPPYSLYIAECSVKQPTDQPIKNIWLAQNVYRYLLILQGESEKVLCWFYKLPSRISFIERVSELDFTSPLAMLLHYNGGGYQMWASHMVAGCGIGPRTPA